MDYTALPDTSADIIVLIPGIMGSELVDKESRRVLWGGSSMRWYLDAWLSPNGLAELQLTDAELEGEYARVRATKLLSFPAFAPLFQGIEPYTRLQDHLVRIAASSGTVRTFPYDWRLPISCSAQQLGRFLDRELEQFSGTRRNRREVSSGSHDEPNLVIVAHSMGGLLVRALATRSPDLLSRIRATITLGTPFFGSIKAAMSLNSGTGAPVPLPRRKFREIAKQLPSIYDLLPRNRCVDLGNSVEHLTASAVSTLGGSENLALEAEHFYKSVKDTSLPSASFVVGAHQPTNQAITITDGIAIGHEYTCRAARDDRKRVLRRDIGGDGTVARDCAQLPNIQALPLAQSHGALSKSAESLVIVNDILQNHTTGPWLGATQLGLRLPDIVAAGESFPVRITGASAPRDVAMRAIDLETHRPVPTSPPQWADGEVLVHFAPPVPGVYRVECVGGGMSAVSEFTMAVPSDVASLK